MNIDFTQSIFFVAVIDLKQLHYCLLSEHILSFCVHTCIILLMPDVIELALWYDQNLKHIDTPTVFHVVLCNFSFTNLFLNQILY